MPPASKGENVASLPRRSLASKGCCLPRSPPSQEGCCAEAAVRDPDDDDDDDAGRGEKKGPKLHMEMDKIDVSYRLFLFEFRKVSCKTYTPAVE